jgi:hypothetical protein
VARKAYQEIHIIGFSQDSLTYRKLILLGKFSPSFSTFVFTIY